MTDGKANDQLLTGTPTSGAVTDGTCPPCATEAPGAAPQPPTQPQPQKPTKRIAIVGCSDSKNLAPFDDPAWEIWAMNNAYAHTKRWTQWFEIHPIKFENGHFLRRNLIRPGVFKWDATFRGYEVDRYMRDLAGLDCPVWMQQHWEVIPKSKPYPLKEVTERFGTYFTNSVSFMIVLAIMQGATEIGTYGVDMATGSEYGPQRPSCEFFLGVAAGMGITITIPDEADLLKTRFLYGFGEREQTAWEAKMMAMQQNLEARRQKAAQQAMLQQKMVDQYIGAQMASSEIQRIWSNLADTKTWKDKV